MQVRPGQEAPQFPGANRTMNLATISAVIAEVAGGALALAAAAGYVFWAAAKAPRGHEDLQGFHFDPEPLAKGDGRKSRWNRAKSPSLDEPAMGGIHHRPRC